jgi:hypothetical protein
MAAKLWEEQKEAAKVKNPIKKYNEIFSSPF